MRVAVLIMSALLTACPRPPVGQPDTPTPEGRVGPVALELFTQDRPAIAGKWYDYNPDGHTLDPKPQAWILKDGARHAAFRILSIYEPDAAESGLFTLSIALHDGESWASAQEYVASRNIKSTGPLCLDVFAPNFSESDCTDDAWQMRFAIFQYLSPLAGIAVADPGVFVRSVAGTDSFGTVSVARIDDVTSLDSLPDPTTLAVLEDAPPVAWDNTDWDFAQLAADLPEAGMAIGTRFLDAPDDVYWLMTSRFDLVRFTVKRVDDTLEFSFSSVEVDRDDWSAPELPDVTVVQTPLPQAGDASWLTFTTADLLPPAEDTLDKEWPYLPPKTTHFDLAIEQPTEGVIRVIVSQAACVVNATELGLDEQIPPVSTTP